MASLKECKQLIDSSIDKMEFQGRQPEALYEPIGYILKLGGKRLRPVFTLMAGGLFAPEIAHIVSPALAIEIFHNFTLLHDDIMDKADMRRGHQTVHQKWNQNIAILSGDAMNIIAYQYLCDTKKEFLPALLDIFSATALEICEGQQLDMDFESRQDVSIKEYLEMIRLKTAVLIAASLKIGAICGGADKTNQDLLYRFGLNLGLAFQIQDDYLDAFGNEKDFGKNIGGDIVACKKTYLYLKALEVADSIQKAELFRIYNDLSLPREDKIQAVLGIFKKLNIDCLAEEMVTAYTDEAMRSLSEVSCPGSKKELEDLGISIMSRNK